MKIGVKEGRSEVTRGKQFGNRGERLVFSLERREYAICSVRRASLATASSIERNETGPRVLSEAEGSALIAESCTC